MAGGRWLKAAGLALALVLGACDPDDGGGDGDGGGGVIDGGTGGGDTGNGQSWTVLVYMNADNDLEPFALQDLTEMMAVGSSDRLKLVVQVDRHPGYANQAVGNLANFTNTKRVLVQQGSLQVVQEMGEVDLAAPAALEDFVRWGMQTYPADRTAVVMWDHGSGWTGFGVDESTGPGQLLTLPEIEAGLRAGLGQRKVAMIGFDACLMANLEVALSLAPFADYLLASEDVEPGHGWDWRSLALLKATPTSNTEALAQRIIADFRAQASDPQLGNGEATLTLSLTDLRQVGAVRDALKTFTDQVLAGGAPRVTALGNARSGARSYQDSPDPRRSLHLYDLADVAERTGKADAQLAAAAQAVRDRVKAAVRANFAGSARSGSNGLTVYFPPDAEYVEPSYAQLSGGAEWRSFLSSVFGTGGGAPVALATPTFTNPDHEGLGLVDEDGMLVYGTLAEGALASVADVTLTYGLGTDEGWVLFGDVQGQAGVESGTPYAAGLWDLQVLSLTQNGRTAYGFNSLRYDTTTVTVSMEFLYRTPADTAGRSAVRQIAFSRAATPTLLSDTTYVLNGDAWGELSPEPGSTLTPLLLVLPFGGEATWVPFMPDEGPGFDATRGIDLAWEDIDPATDRPVGYLEATNAVGDGDYVTYVHQP
jgi:hypothetical protein